MCASDRCPQSQDNAASFFDGSALRAGRCVCLFGRLACGLPSRVCPIVFRYLSREVLLTLSAVSAVLPVIIMSGRFIKYLAQAAA